MAIHPFTYPLHLPASTGSSQPRPPSCPSELGAVARSSLGSVGMAIPVQVIFDCADPPVIAGSGPMRSATSCKDHPSPPPRGGPG